MSSHTRPADTDDTSHHRHSDADIEQIRADIEQTRADVADVKAAVLSMKEIVDAWNDAKSFVRTIERIGNVLRWVAKIGAAVGSIWLLIKTGQWFRF